MSIKNIKPRLPNFFLEIGLINIYSLMILALGIGVFAAYYSAFGKEQEAINNIGLCCESGDGPKCHPLTTEGKTFTYNGKKYGLLKSNITMTEGATHLLISSQTFNGHPIVLNDSQKSGLNNSAECGHGTLDQVWKGTETLEELRNQGQAGQAKILDACTTIADDAVIYVCTRNCQAIVTGTQDAGGSSLVNTSFDAYFSEDEYKQNGIPKVISECAAAQNPNPTPAATQRIVFNGDGSNPNLQLKTFHVEEEISPTLTNWLSPWCKPAIYLYPPTKTQVSVNVVPPGGVTFSIPQYSPTGWQVTAYPNGSIETGNSKYNYLYYEARIPDQLIAGQAKQGYVVSYSGLPKLFNTLLPALGLNDNEKEAFANYWLKALPKANYYFVGVVPQSLLDKISPLTFSPTPQSVIRVNLYFQALDKSQEAVAPNLVTPKRGGFTVVEWGGLFKKDKNSTFTCLM